MKLPPPRPKRRFGRLQMFMTTLTSTVGSRPAGRQGCSSRTPRQVARQRRVLVRDRQRDEDHAGHRPAHHLLDPAAAAALRGRGRLHVARDGAGTLPAAKSWIVPTRHALD